MAVAQEDGVKGLDALVERGQEIERRLRQEAASKRKKSTGPSAGTVEPRGTEKLRLLFDNRVAAALDRLGMRPTADVQKLAKRVERLAARVEALKKQIAADKRATKAKTRRGQAPSTS